MINYISPNAIEESISENEQVQIVEPLRYEYFRSNAYEYIYEE